MTVVRDVRDLLPLYALGLLELDEAGVVEQAVAADPALAAELHTYLETAHQLDAVTPPVAPSPGVKARLLASVGGGRFERFSGRMGQLFDVSVDRARELLGLTERAASWEVPAPGLGVHLVHFSGGPAYAAADCGFVQIDPGCTFPWHTHRGEEVTLVLVGALQTSDGVVVRAGDELVRVAGTQHDLTCVGSEPVIFLARAMNGIDLGPHP